VLWLGLRAVKTSCSAQDDGMYTFNELLLIQAYFNYNFALFRKLSVFQFLFGIFENFYVSLPTRICFPARRASSANAKYRDAVIIPTKTVSFNHNS
jgi:hypothetical protein